jgi:hypothetical protein
MGLAERARTPQTRVRAQQLIVDQLTCCVWVDRWGIGMAVASVEVSGEHAERLAGELQAALSRAVGPAEGVSPVEVDRSPELVVAVFGVVFSGIQPAKTIWDWWQSQRSGGVTVRILLEDGSQVDLSGIDQRQLQVEFERRTKPGS